MRISLEEQVRVGDQIVPPGNYTVELDESSATVSLKKDGFTARLKAVLRASKVQVRKPSVQVRRVAGERRLLLVLRTPPASEWVASLDLD